MHIIGVFKFQVLIVLNSEGEKRCDMSSLVTYQSEGFDKPKKKVRYFLLPLAPLECSGKKCSLPYVPKPSWLQSLPVGELLAFSFIMGTNHICAWLISTVDSLKSENFKRNFHFHLNWRASSFMQVAASLASMFDQKTSFANREEE